MTAEPIVEVLLVEDNPDEVELTLRSFRESNVVHRIHVARDGVEALDFLFGTGAQPPRCLYNGPRLVLLDLKLPRVNGLDVLRQLKANPRTRMIPVVVMTSSHEERDLVDCCQLGVNSYVLKPVSFTQLAEVIQELAHYWLVLNKTPAL